MAIVYAFTPHCRAVVQQIRMLYPPRHRAMLFRAIRQIAANPQLPRSGLSCHDPQYPTARFYRVPRQQTAPHFTVFYRVADDGTVLFTDVWHLPP